jgi:DNA-binding MarR family transcriptional regulator
MLFLKKKPAQIILVLKNRPEGIYLSKLALEAGATYVYTTKQIDIMKAMDLVVVEPKGKFRIVKLTDNGKSVAATVDSVMKFEKPKVIQSSEQQL